jgi:hypothetical protein
MRQPRLFAAEMRTAFKPLRLIQSRFPPVSPRTNARWAARVEGDE